MRAKDAAATAAIGLVVGLVVWLVDPGWRTPVAAACIIGAMGVVALRERRAVRQMATRLARIDDQTRKTRRVVAAVEVLAGRLAEEVVTRGELRQATAEQRKIAQRDFRQFEALLNLHALIRPRSALPSSRIWAASPDLLLHLTAHVRRHKPQLIVELGSGVSTAWLAYAVESTGGTGKIISIDHDKHYAEATRTILRENTLDHLADVREAPLVEIHIHGKTWHWYDPAVLADIHDCDLLIVDGPPATTGPQARYPALPMLSTALAPHATVIVDDYIRQEEKDIINAWQQHDPTWQLNVLDHEKGTAILSR